MGNQGTGHIAVAIARKLGLGSRIDAALKRLNFNRRISLNGATVTIPFVRGVRCHSSEPWLVPLMARLLSIRQGCFLDVGVNVGQSLIKVKSLDPARGYVGFEPNPSCVAYVQELIEANCYENCVVFPVGLHTRDAVLRLELFSKASTDASASLVPNFRPGKAVRSSILVPVFRFESLSGVIPDNRVGIVKVDVEGSELDVIRSLIGVIKRDRPIVILEVLPVYSHDGSERKTRQEEMERLFREEEYTLHRVRKTSSDSYAGLERIETIGVHADLSQCDYVLAPRELDLIASTRTGSPSPETSTGSPVNAATPSMDR